MKYLVSLFLFVSTLSFGASDDLALRDRVYDFLKANVIGRTVLRDSVSKNPDKTLEYDFHRSMKYVNLVKTDRGLTYDTIVLIKQNNYDLNADGSRIAGAKPTNTDRQLVVRVELTQSMAAPILIGFNRILTNSFMDPTGIAMDETAKIVKDELILKEQMGLFGDGFASKGTFKPIRSTNVARFSLNKDKKLVVKEHTETSYVDPETLAPTSELKVAEIDSVEP